MAKIDIGNFGNRMPTPSQQKNVPTVQDVSFQAQANLFGVIGNIAQKYNQERDDLTKLKVAAELQERELSTNDMTTKLERDVRNGVLPAASALSEFSNRTSLLREKPKDYDNWPKALQMQFDMKSSAIGRNGLERIYAIEDAGLRTEQANAVSVYNENLIKQASFTQTPEQFHQLMAVLDTPDMQRIFHSNYQGNAAIAKEDLINKSGQMVFNYKFSGAQSAEQINAELETLPQYNLNGETTQRIYLDAQSRIVQLERQEQARLKELENKAIQAGKDIEDSIFSGYRLSPQAWDDYYNLVKGTVYEAQYNEKKAIEGFVLDFQKKTPEQQAIIHNQQVIAAKGATHDDPKGVRRRLQAIERFQEESAKRKATDPRLDSDMKLGRQPSYIDPTQFLSDPGKFVDELKRRQTDAIGSDRVFYSDEINMIKPIIDKANADQKSAIYSALYSAFQSNPKMYTQALIELGADDKVFTMAGVLYSKQPYVSKDVPINILRGQQALKDKNYSFSKEQDYKDQFNSDYASVYKNSPSGYSQHYDTAKAYYAYLATSSGDYSGEFNKDLWKKAVKATGGEVVKINGSSVMAPIGMPPDVFEERIVNTANHMAKTGSIGDVWKTDFKGNRLPSGYAIEQLTETKFALTLGVNPVTDNNHNRVVIDVLKPGPRPEKTPDVYMFTGKTARRR